MAAPQVSGVIGLMLVAGIPPERVVDVVAHQHTLGPEEYSPSMASLINALGCERGGNRGRNCGHSGGNTINRHRQRSAWEEAVYSERVPAGVSGVRLAGRGPRWVEVEPGDYFAESPPFILNRTSSTR